MLIALARHWSSLLGVPVSVEAKGQAPASALGLAVPGGHVFLDPELVAVVGALQLLEPPDTTLTDAREEAAARALSGEDAAFTRSIPDGLTWVTLRVGDHQGAISEVVSQAEPSPEPEAVPASSRPVRAAVMMVDLSGELRSYIMERLKSGALVAARPSERLSELDESTAVLVLGPDPSLFRELEAARTLVLKRPA